MNQEILIVADVPATKPGLGFPEYASALRGAICGGHPARFTIGLYGPWGSGKSSLLNALANDLSNTEYKVIPVMFDAWRYEKTPNLIVPLLHNIYLTVNKYADSALSASFRKAIRSIVFGLKFDLGVLSVGVDSDSIRKAWDEEDLLPLDEAFARPYQELKNISASLGERRICILIDDLDRCSPESVVSVLESINLVMDVPGFIFVLALDYDVLVHAVQEKYPHVSPHIFLQKMIQLPFRVPPLDLEGRDFITELIPSWSQLTDDFSDENKELLRELAILGLKANPRQIKRLLNSFLLLNQVVKERALSIDSNMLMVLLTLQLRWPTKYLDIQDAVLANNPEPFSILQQDEENVDLIRFTRRFFDSHLPNDVLRQLLQLTEAVSLDNNIEDDQIKIDDVKDMSQAREKNRMMLPDKLKLKGYHKSPRSTRLFYNPEKPNTRFVIGKHVIRFETRSSKKWELLSSYLLSREADLALNMASNENKRFKGS